jgi:hypothetical protein
MTKPSEVVREFFQGLVAGLPTGNMQAVDRHMTSGLDPALKEREPPRADLTTFFRGLR